MKRNVGDLVNIESHLRRMDLHDSKCVQGRTLDEMNVVGDNLKKKVKSGKSDCNRLLNSTYSRMEDPAINVKSMTTSRFDFPIEDPRGQVYYGMNEDQQGDMRFGTNSRHESRSMDTDEYLKKLDRKYEFKTFN